MKKSMLVIVMIIACLCLYGCKGESRSSDEDKTALSTQKESSSESESRLTILTMKINAGEALMDLADSNGYMIESLKAIKTENNEEAINYGNKALDLVNDAAQKTKDVISSPNFLEENIKELQENYKRTMEIIEKSPGISEEEVEEFYDLLEKGSAIHLYLLKSYQSFVNLYSIRDFDSLPDKKARETLEETWWQFGFKDNVKCPDTIDKKELYLIWTKQYAGKEPSQFIINEIEKLRNNDDMKSKDYNKKWIELVEEICSTNE